ncbi:MAG: amidohydrolase family protein [Desulfoferrobacter sp.]
MKIDVHTHIFPPEIVDNRGLFFTDEAMFQALYGNPKARLATAEILIEAMDKAEIDCSVTFGFPWQNTELAKRHNDYVLASASKYPSRLVPMGCVNPVAKNALQESERVLQAGVRGLGELAIYEHCDESVALDCYKGLIECCRSYNGILLIHANEPIGHSYPGKAPFGLDFYYAIARLAEGLPLILAHWGGGLCFYEMLRKEVPETLGSVYYDTAASPFLYRSGIYAHMTEIVGAEKILFGTDYPLLAANRYFAEMANLGLAADVIDAITGGNAARLFGLAQ